MLVLQDGRSVCTDGRKEATDYGTEHNLGQSICRVVSLQLQLE